MIFTWVNANLAATIAGGSVIIASVVVLCAALFGGESDDI